MSAVIYQGFKLAFATLYPAYASYKAVKTKNVKDYVKWMMYWVVYAFFVAVELIADVFVAWIPFYYELKIVFVLWLLSPATKGSSIVYRKLIHPQLAKRESDIDTCIDKASDHGYSALLTLGSRAISLATNIVVASAVKGQTKLADHLSRSAILRAIDDDDDDGGDDVTRHKDGRLDRRDGGGAQEDMEVDDGEVRLQRSATGSRIVDVQAAADERDNAIIRESYRREISCSEISEKAAEDSRARRDDVEETSMRSRRKVKSTM
jgi:receptor expression-enhancing protein 1/2/3/4